MPGKEKSLSQRIVEVYWQLVGTRNAVGTYVDFKRLFQKIEGKKTLKQFKETLVDMAKKNPQFHLSLAPELMVDRRYAIPSDRGWLYDLSIQKHMPKTWNGTPDSTESRKTEGKCKFGFEIIEVTDGKCMDALNFTEYISKKDEWNKNCTSCPLFGRSKTDKADIRRALQEKGIVGEDD